MTKRTERPQRYREEQDGEKEEREKENESKAGNRFMGKQKDSKTDSEMHKEANGGRDKGVKCAVCPVQTS